MSFKKDDNVLQLCFFFNYYNLFCKDDGVITGLCTFDTSAVICSCWSNHFTSHRYTFLILLTLHLCVCVCDLSATRAAAADGGVRLERGPPVYPGFPTGRERPIHPAAQSHRHKPHLRQQWVSDPCLRQRVFMLTSYLANASYENLFTLSYKCSYGNNDSLSLGVFTLELIW